MDEEFVLYLLLSGNATLGGVTLFAADTFSCPF